MWRKTAIVFPARAGMSPRAHVSPEPFTGVPRASGDEPRESFAGAFLLGCSPRERG